MEKEAVELFEAAKKAAIVAVKTGSNSAEESRCIDALIQLRNLPVTYQLLANTQVAKRLRFLTKFPNKKIKDFTNDVIQTWKSRIINLQKTTKPAVENPVIHYVIRWKRPLPECEDEFRNSVREIIYNNLYKVVGEVGVGEERKKLRACDPLQVAVMMETCLFQEWATNKEDEDMEIKFRALLHIIGHPKNPDIRKKVLLGQITATSIAALSAKDIARIGMQKLENPKIEDKRKRTKRATPTITTGARRTTEINANVRLVQREFEDGSEDSSQRRNLIICKELRGL